MTNLERKTYNAARDLMSIKEDLKDSVLNPPEISFLVAFILFFVMMSSMFTYFTIDFIDDYVNVKDILENGQLVDAE